MITMQINSFEQVPAGLNAILHEISQLREAVAVAGAARVSDLKKPSALTLRTRSETAKIMRISLGTLNTLTKDGGIKASRVGNRVFYKDEDIEAALNAVKTRASNQ
jgi:excisionase family DNA binding protein